MDSEPSPSAALGRTNAGQFDHGNRLSRGNPHSSKVQKLRSAMLAAITTDDVQDIIKKLVDMAKQGDLKSAKILLDTVGRPDLHTAPSAPLPPATIEVTRSNLEEIKTLLVARVHRLTVAKSAREDRPCRVPTIGDDLDFIPQSDAPDEA